MDHAFSTETLERIRELADEASGIDVDVCNDLMAPWLFADAKIMERVAAVAVTRDRRRLLAVAVIEMGGALPEGASPMLYEAAIHASTALALADIITEQEAAALAFAWSFVAAA
jgi:hypothetical protein